MMKLAIDLKHLEQRRFDIRLMWDVEEIPASIELKALGAATGLSLVNIHDITDDIEGKRPTNVDFSSLTLFPSLKSKGLEYSIMTPLEEKTGGHRDIALNFPAISKNIDNAYLGMGCLPSIIATSSKTVINKIDVQVMNIPKDLGIYSSLFQSGHVGVINVDQMAEFFLFVGRDIVPHLFSVETGIHHRMEMSVYAIPSMKTKVNLNKLESYIGEYFTFLRNTYGDYRKVKWVNILIAPRSKGFQILLKDTGMNSGGFNCQHGIEIDGPEDPEITGKVFGYDSYIDFIYDGITHEIGHFYTSAGTGRQKAILYFSDQCPKRLRSVLGESINGYLHTLYMKYRYQKNGDLLFTEALPRWLARQRKTGTRHSWIDLLISDIELRSHYGYSVPKLFRDLVQEKLSNPAYIDHEDFMWDTVRHIRGFEIESKLRDLLLGPKQPDYGTMLPIALAKVGWKADLETGQISQIDGSTCHFEFP